MSSIPYTTRGKYFSPCHDFVQAYRGPIARGQLIIWQPGWLGGFKGDHLALILPGTEFHATFGYSDSTAFSVKLRHLATGLRDNNLLHLYHLTHDNGTITVQRIDRPASGSSDPQILVPTVKKSENWWRELQDLLTRAMAVGIPFKKIIFRKGGKIPIPDWFRDWCRKHGIEIEVLEPEEFDRRFARDPLVVNGVVQIGEQPNRDR